MSESWCNAVPAGSDMHGQLTCPRARTNIHIHPTSQHPRSFESVGRLGELPLTAQVGSPGEALLHSHPASFQNVYIYILNDISVYMYRCIFMHNFCNPQDDQRNSAAARPRGATDHHRATRQRCAVECRYFIYTYKYLCLHMYIHIHKRQCRCEHNSKHGWQIAVSIARSTAMVYNAHARSHEEVSCVPIVVTPPCSRRGRQLALL